MPIRSPVSLFRKLRFPKSTLLASRMSSKSFNLPDCDPPVSVRLPEELSKDDLLNFPAFKAWMGTLKHSLGLQTQEKHAFHKNPYQLRSLEVQTADWFGPKKDKLGFVKLKAEVTNDEGEYLPGSVFLRGASVAMLPDDVPDGSEQDKHVILTIQPRVPVGSLAFAEIPAGMLDDAGSMKGAAMAEIREETGLEVGEAELVNMSELSAAASPLHMAGDGNERLAAAVYPSAGGCDESIQIFLAEKRVDRASLDEWRGKLTGLREHSEKITLALCRLEDLWKTGSRDAKAMTAWALYSGLKRDGRI